MVCRGPLIRWGGYWRRLRRHAEVTRVRVPRCRCQSCGRTQNLLPASALHRRLDTVETIGWAVVRSVNGASVRATAAELELPASTVRDWLSRHQERAPALARGLMAWAVGLGEEVGRHYADDDRRAVAALGAASHAVRRRWPDWPVGPWRLWGLMSGGRALGTNTSPLFPFHAEAQMMAAASPCRPP
jgi:hypothetical protein